MNKALLGHAANFAGAVVVPPGQLTSLRPHHETTQAQLNYQKEQLKRQRANMSGAMPVNFGRLAARYNLAKAKPVYLPKKGGGPPNNGVRNNEEDLDSDSDSDVTEVLNPNELPDPNNHPPMGNNRPSSHLQGGRRRRRRVTRRLGGTHRRGHKSRHSRRRHSRRQSRRRQSRRRQ